MQSTNLIILKRTKYSHSKSNDGNCKQNEGFCSNKQTIIIPLFISSSHHHPQLLLLPNLSLYAMIQAVNTNIAETKATARPSAPSAGCTSSKLESGSSITAAVPTKLRN